jgi:hypothetical protein
MFEKDLSFIVGNILARQRLQTMNLMHNMDVDATIWNFLQTLI